MNSEKHQKKNFITPDKYLSINTNEDANFLEKKMTYRILGNIRFKMKSPVDRSKLLKFTKNFDSLLAINFFLFKLEIILIFIIIKLVNFIE
jgi:hypothetical protein